MADAVDIGTRTQQALLVNLRQQLIAPVDALVGYGELLRERAEESDLQEMLADLDQILSAARELSQHVNNLLDDGISRKIFERTDLEQAERQLKHDLRTPINAIKGYGEMLLNDLEEFSAQHLRTDFEKLLSETNHLLSELDTLVRFSPHGVVDAVHHTDQDTSSTAQPIGNFEHVEESALREESKHGSDEERRERQFIRQAFSRFVSAEVVDQLVSDPSKLTLGGERLDITCVFTGLVGFASLIESNEPSAVSPVLNRYLGGLCRVFLEHDGTIDKIVGDALHGFFGAPLKQPDHASKAIRCALDLNDYARHFMTAADAAALGFGATHIGVHSGSAVVGNFGGDSFFDYTAHGDVIGTAALMESANRHLGTTICVSGDTASQCRDIAFRPIGQLFLKGKSQRIETFEPLRDAHAKSPEIISYLDAYRLMERSDENALLAFTDVAKRYPDDPLAVLHVHRLAQGQTGTLIATDDK